MSINNWEKDQAWEANWWGDCLNTYGEETKQFEYAPKMGLEVLSDSQGKFFLIGGVSVLDVGGGPISLLLKCRDRGRSAVVDPCNYPAWITRRYKEGDIEYKRTKAEAMSFDEIFDEVWLYNVLQHVDSLEGTVRGCQKYGKIIRVFEWLEIGVAPGHPHNLLEEELNDLFRGEGKVIPAQRGKEYYGIFLGDTYE